MRIRHFPSARPETKSLSTPDSDLLAPFAAAPASGDAVELGSALTVPRVQFATSPIWASIRYFLALAERRADEACAYAEEAA